MGYYDDLKNVEEYIGMAEGIDGRELIEVLKRYLKTDSRVLKDMPKWRKTIRFTLC